MNTLPYDVINKIYEFIDIKKEHENALRPSLFKIEDVQPWETFRAYFAQQYFKDPDFWSLRIQIFEEPENRWRNASVNTAFLFGGFYDDDAPSHSVVHVHPMKGWEAFDWDTFNGWWKPI